jgi:hypothetical protein
MSDFATRLIPEDRAELLEEIDKLSKLAAEKEASGAELLEKIDILFKLITEKMALDNAIVKKKDLIPLEAFNVSAISHGSGSGLIGVDHSQEFPSDADDNAPGDAKANATKGGDSVEELTSFFYDNQPGVHQKINKVSFETVETEADFTDTTKILKKPRLGRSRSRERLMKYIPVKTSQAAKVAVQKEPAVDFMGFPLAKSYENLFDALCFVMGERFQQRQSICG